jgi:hypothetical protein
MIALAEGPNEISFALPGVDVFLLKSSLTSRVSEMVALAVPSILCIEDCRLILANRVFPRR